jgi:hypothetical protein
MAGLPGRLMLLDAPDTACPTIRLRPYQTDALITIRIVKAEPL